MSETVVTCLSDYLDVDPCDLDPLEQSVNTDALDALFSTRANGMERPHGELTFPYEGYQITVRADGDVLVRAPGQDDG